MTRPTPIDLALALLLGAAIATGNPFAGGAYLPAIVLPLPMMAVVMLATGTGERAAPRAIAALRWTAAVFVAYVLLWYEQYKLTGAAGSVMLFTTLTDWLGLHGHEQAMRLGVGIAEIAAATLTLIPWTQGLGALGVVALMSGAMFFHLVSPLGTDPYHDGAFLFRQAVAVWTAGAVLAWWRRDQLLALSRNLALRQRLA